MKKITAGILTAALVIALGGATVSTVGLGQSAKGSAVQDRTQEQLYKNADGICDYYEDGVCQGDSDGDGICDYHENSVCRGDSDGDGVCDYRENVSDTSDAAYGSDVCGNGWHHSYGSGNGSAHGAHEAGLSFGKYRAYLELKELDPEITPDDIRDLSMREIQDMIDSLSGEDSASSDENTAVPESTGVSDDTGGESGHHSEEHDGGQENRHRHNR